MAEPIVVEMVSGKALLWRCLHGGPLTAESIDAPSGDGRVPYAEFRDRNLAFLSHLCATYGACAVAARSGDAVVGHLRFYPKAVREMAGGGLGLCLQQAYPYGPADDFGGAVFPELPQIEDKTLLVHCMMITPDEPGRGSLRRKGIGSRMAERLVSWAAAAGWNAVETTAYMSLPIIYTISGQAGRSFWEDLGFRVVRTEREPLLEQENDFVRTMREQARARGLDAASVSDRFTMRRDLGSVGAF